MRKLLHDPIFDLRNSVIENKVMPLKEAVSRFVRKGMLIHTGQTNIRWCCAIYNEIARQFWGKEGNLSLVGVSMNFPQSILVHGGIVKKIITSYFGDPYIIPSPNRAYTRALADGSLEIENWSIYTISLRLKAAARGLPFLPTHSLTGSDIEKENKDNFIRIDDPFDKGKKIGLVKALYPDLSVIHAWMADTEGNAVFSPPYTDNMDGAMAAKEGVLLTTEKIVSTETIRKYSHMVGLPGKYVCSVSEVPFGCHPSGLSTVGLEGIPLYVEDYDFAEEAHQSCKNPDTFQKWIDKWVLSCENHEDYLSKLGYDRILQLKGDTHPDAWQYNIEAVDKISKTGKYTPIEMAVVVMGRKLKERVENEKYHTLLAGAGIANLAAWLCYYSLEEDGKSVDLLAEVGMYGYAPRPTQPFIFGGRNFLSCKKTTDTATIMGLFVGGVNASCIGALGAAQIDEHGNLNTTQVSKDTYIVGSGGANDVASRAKEIIGIVVHGKSRMPKDVYYITSPGRIVTTVVSTMGIFTRPDSNSRFTLTGYYPHKEKDTETIIKKIRDLSEWSFDVSDDIKELSPPTTRELELIRIFDPHRNYFGPLPT